MISDDRLTLAVVDLSPAQRGRHHAALADQPWRHRVDLLRDPDENGVELQEAGGAMADLLRIPPDGGCVLGRIDEYRSVD
jgi:hypothetical protein